MVWKRIGKTINSQGATITYGTKDTDITIESRRRHIPHANGSGTWDHTSYFVLRGGIELKEKMSLRDAQAYVEQLLKEAPYDK